MKVSYLLEQLKVAYVNRDKFSISVLLTRLESLGYNQDKIIQILTKESRNEKSN